MSIDPKVLVALIAILAVVGGVVFIADFVIFVRWVGYRWKRYDEEERMAQYEIQRRSTIGNAAAAPSTVGAVSHQETPTSQDSARYSPDVASSEIAPDALGASPQSVADARPEMAFPDYPSLPEPPFARTWSVVDPFLGIQFVILVGQLVTLLLLLPVLIHPGSGAMGSMTSPAGIFMICLGLIFQNMLFVGVVWFYVRRYGSSLSDIGLRMPKPSQIALGIGLGLVLFGVVTGGEIGLNQALPHLLPKSAVDFLTALTNALTAGGIFDNIASMPLKIFFALAGAVAAPIGEEVFFRGLLYNSLKKRLNVPAAIVLSGLIFALVHFGPLAILLIFPMGMILAYVYEKTKSLWVTICIHATHNGLTFLAAMVFPQAFGAPKEPVKPPPARPAILYAMPAPLVPATNPRRMGSPSHG